MDEKSEFCVILKSSVRHHNKSYEYENDNIYSEEPKNQ